MSTWLFIDCFLLILIIWWIYDLLKGEFLINKLGAKVSFRCMTVDSFIYCLRYICITNPFNI